MVDKVCLNCKKSFSVYRYREDRAIVCSNECRWAYFKGKTLNTGRTHFKKGHVPHFKGNGINKQCAICGVAFYVWRAHHKVKCCSRECGYKFRRSFAGKDNPGWRGGITPEHKKIRRSKEYQVWRSSVFERDNYTCQKCGTRGGSLHADHIKQFAHFPELRLELTNGRTLCVPCHRATPSYKKEAMA